jgi:inner membrane protein involved in colicin E2 resistance
MKKKTEFEQFDKVMAGLLAVPYSELQQKLEAEKRAKAQKKKRATSSPASVRASSGAKKRVV